MHVQTGTPSRLLDLSRTVARGAARVYTGIDRAEIAYLHWLISQESAAFGLVRTGLGYLLLDRDGLVAVSAALSAPERIGRADRLSRLTHRRDGERGRFETLVRNLAVGRCTRPRLGELFRRSLPPGSQYLNVGHSNLTERVFRAVAGVPQSFATIVLHDLFPLTHPQYCRPEAAAKARRLAQVVSARADRVVHISSSMRLLNEVEFEKIDRCPPGIVAPLGVRPLPEASSAPREMECPYFLALGTLEPRKNLPFLLDLWKGMPDPPALVLAGSRGWEDPAFFTRLKEACGPGKKIHWIENADDARVGALLAHARGLLFPSHAEGQGLPPFEAASVGVPVICQRLPSLAEVLGDYPDYTSCDDLAGWTRKIKGLLAGESPLRLTRPDTLPTWEQHFALVFDGEKNKAAGGRADEGSAVCV